MMNRATVEGVQSTINTVPTVAFPESYSHEERGTLYLS